MANDGAAGDGGGARADVGGGDARAAISDRDKQAIAGFGDDLLAELVAEHSQPLPPEVKQPQAVRGLERYVGVPVRPGSFERAGARLVGGRVVPLQSQRAAMLQYVVGTGDDARRVSVLVYDAQKIEGGHGESRSARGRHGRGAGRPREGLLGRGHAAGGVGYLVASDLDPDKSAQLAAMVYDDR